MKMEGESEKEYLNRMNSTLSEKDIILNRNIEYAFTLEQERSALKQEINSKEQELNSLKQEINSKEQELNSLKQEIKTKEKTIAQLKDENELFKSTISWRITKPLRYIGKLIRALFNL